MLDGVFANILTVNSLMPVTLSAKSSLLDVWLDYEYAYETGLLFPLFHTSQNNTGTSSFE